MYELDGTALKLTKEKETKASVKCGTFGASGLADATSTGNFEGYLQLYDLEHADKPIMDVKAHLHRQRHRRLRRPGQRLRRPRARHLRPDGAYRPRVGRPTEGRARRGV